MPRGMNWHHSLKGVFLMKKVVLTRASLVAIGTLKQGAARGAAITVRGLCDGIPIAAEGWLEIIHTDEQDIGFLREGGKGRYQLDRGGHWLYAAHRRMLASSARLAIT